MRRIDTIEHQKQKEKADKITKWSACGRSGSNWWTNEYKYPKDFKYTGENEQREGQIRGHTGRGGSTMTAEWARAVG